MQRAAIVSVATAVQRCPRLYDTSHIYTESVHVHLSVCSMSVPNCNIQNAQVDKYQLSLIDARDKIVL